MLFRSDYAVVFPMYVGVNRPEGSADIAPFGVFPMYVGVNRQETGEFQEGESIPHACGVNRSSDWAANTCSIPHACGGEPVLTHVR